MFKKNLPIVVPVLSLIHKPDEASAVTAPPDVIFPEVVREGTVKLPVLVMFGCAGVLIVPEMVDAEIESETDSDVAFSGCRPEEDFDKEPYPSRLGIY